MGFEFNRKTKEALRRMATDEETSTLLINFFQELVDDLRAVNAKLDVDTGVDQNDFAATTTDDDPTDGQ